MLNLDKSGWETVRLGEVVRNVNENVRDLEGSGIERVIALEHLDPGEITISRYGDVSDGTTFTRRVRPGQTLFGKRRAYQRKAAYAEVGAICSGDILVFEAVPSRLSSRLLPFLVHSERFFEHALGTSAGSLSPRTSWKALATFKFSLPPLDEQERIADLLWAAHGARSDLRQAERAGAGVRDSLLGSLAAGSVTVGNVVAAARAGATPSRRNLANFGGSIPWVKSGEVASAHLGVTGESLSEEGLAGSSAWMVPQGAILVALYGDGKTRGTVGLAGAACATNQAVLALVPDQYTDSKFLYYWLQSRQAALREKSAGGTQKNLNKALVLSEPFPDMARVDQVAFVSKVEEIEALMSAYSRTAESLLKLLHLISREAFRS